MEIKINTALGQVIGNQKKNYQEFLGLRYAEPPVGSLRFEPPKLVTSYQTPYKATAFGNVAPQAYVEDPPIIVEENEDCLFLNIYTPKADDKKRPVMVYIHGGGFVIGTASRPRIDGGNLVTRGDVVIVNIQYRLGVFGFLKINGISPNLGLQDQICALKWIHENINAFGGDSNNITIFGESAGASSVFWLMMASEASGLFHKGICQSGALDFENIESHSADSEYLTQKFLKQLKIDPTHDQLLREMPYDRLYNAGQAIMKGSLISRRFFSPFPDGDIIPLDVRKAWVTGHANNIPLIIGTNANELPIFSGGFISSKSLQAIVKKMIVKKIRTDNCLTKAELRELVKIYQKYYPYPQYPKYSEYDAILTDIVFWFKSIKMAELHGMVNKVYFYIFNYKAPKIGVTPHVFELPFVFGNLMTKDIAEQFQLEGNEQEIISSNQIMDAWINFARNGDPNHAELPEWHAYDTIKRMTMILDSQCKSVESPREEIRLALEKMLLNKKF